jgi:hypothetical protein
MVSISTVASGWFSFNVLHRAVDSITSLMSRVWITITFMRMPDCEDSELVSAWRHALSEDDFNSNC